MLAAVILVGCCALWGVTQVAIKASAAGGVPVILQAALRSAIAALLVAGWTVVRGGFRELIARDHSLRPGLGIAALFALEFLFLYPGMKLTTASRGVVLLYTAPFWVVAGAHLLLPNERLRPRQVAGLLFAFAGVGCAVADGLTGGGGRPLGDAMVATAAAFWGLTTVMVKANRVLRTLSPAKLLIYQLGVGADPVRLRVVQRGAGDAGGHCGRLVVAGVPNRDRGVRQLPGVVLDGDALPGRTTVGIHIPLTAVRDCGGGADPGGAHFGGTGIGAWVRGAWDPAGEWAAGPPASACDCMKW